MYNDTLKHVDQIYINSLCRKIQKKSMDGYPLINYKNGEIR